MNGTENKKKLGKIMYIGQKEYGNIEKIGWVNIFDFKKKKSFSCERERERERKWGLLNIFDLKKKKRFSCEREKIRFFEYIWFKEKEMNFICI